MSDPLNRLTGNVALTIRSLLADGAAILPLVEAETNKSMAVTLARCAVAYHDAVRVLLRAFPDVRDKVADHGNYVALDRFAQRWRF